MYSGHYLSALLNDADLRWLKVAVERATSHNAIAAKLNERNVRTARGGKWTHVQVGAILHPFVASAGA